MDVASPHSFTSPPRRPHEPSFSKNDTREGRVPRQMSLDSASQFLGSPTRQSISSQMASPRYINQFNGLMEHQRQVHSEERALWHTERQELLEKITQLEASLRRYQNASSSQVLSPIDHYGPSVGSSSSLPSRNQSRDTSASEKGDKVWRGPKIDVKPTRTFSDASDRPAKAEYRLSSIAEDISPRANAVMRGTITSPDRKREVSRETLGPAPKPSVSGAQINKNLDGINFRSSSLTPATAKNIMTPQSPSPRSPSPSRTSADIIEMPPSGLGVPEDQYTRDAGHTPLARRTYFNTDGTSSTRSSDSTTPIQPELERPPLEPQPTRVRIPSERSDSYFPATEDADSNADPALIGPLGLTNDKSEDSSFLNELDSRLKAAMSESPAVAGASESDASKDDDEKDFVQPEAEPKLRIKRSMNFGSAFGASQCGKGL